MMRVIDCLTLEHDLMLTLLAALICVVGYVVSGTVSSRVLSGSHTRLWVLCLATCLGATAWSTHFIALLAYRTSVPMTYAALPTLLSLVLGLVITSLAVAVAVRWRERRAVRAMAGALLGAGVVLLHYVGMASVRFDGSMTYAREYVAASVVAGVALGSVAGMVLFCKGHSWRRPGGVALLVLMTVALHFLGMSAIAVSIDTVSTPTTSDLSREELALAVTVIASVVLAIGASGAIIDRRVALQFAHMARHDALTNLPNRRLFDEIASGVLEQAAPDRDTIAVFAIDMDNFKPINDAYGHAAGDALLCETARRMTTLFADEDVPCRIGGDEFVVLVRSCRDAESCGTLAETLQERLAEPVAFGDVKLQAAASIGVAMLPKEGADIERLLRDADIAMYRAKSEGKGRVRLFDPSMNAALERRLDLERRLRAALHDDAVDVRYQPALDASGAAVPSVRAHLLWSDDERGEVDPRLLASAVDSASLDLALGEFLLRRACRDAARWPEAIRVCVAVSSRQVRHDLAGLVARALERSGLAGERLEIAFREAALRVDDTAVDMIRALRALGVHTTIDDFGTDLLFLDRLREAGVSTFRIEHSLLARARAGLDDREMLRSVLNGRRDLGLRVVAAGIDDDDEAQRLREMGCERVERALVARPVSAEELAALLSSGTIGPPSRGSDSGGDSGAMRRAA